MKSLIKVTDNELGSSLVINHWGTLGLSVVVPNPLKIPNPKKRPVPVAALLYVAYAFNFFVAINANNPQQPVHMTATKYAKRWTD